MFGHRSTGERKGHQSCLRIQSLTKETHRPRLKSVPSTRRTSLASTGSSKMVHLSVSVTKPSGRWSGGSRHTGTGRCPRLPVETHVSRWRCRGSRRQSVRPTAESHQGAGGHHHRPASRRTERCGTRPDAHPAAGPCADARPRAHPAGSGASGHLPSGNLAPSARYGPFLTLSGAV